MAALGGGGGEGRSGVPNKLVVAALDPAGEEAALSPEVVAEVKTKEEVPYRIAVHPRDDGVLCAFPNGCRMVDHWEPDSRMETSFVCITNEVDNSCMDSRLQTRYLTSHIKNDFLGLQNQIYKFHYSNSRGVAKAFTTAFGWETCPYDVQGLPGFIWEKPKEVKDGQLREVSDKADYAFVLFIEAEHGAAMDLWPVPPEMNKKDNFLFFKLYDPHMDKLCSSGRFFINASQKPPGVLRKLNKIAGFVSFEQTAAVDSHSKILFVFHSNLQRWKYSCRRNPSSKSHGFAPVDGSSKSWIVVSWNLAMHLRNLCCFLKDERLQQPQMEVAARDFSELPQEILMDIFSLLETPDLVRVGSVCCSWNSSYTSICSFQQYKWPQTPCLIYTSESAGDNIAVLYSLVEKRAYKLTLPEPPIHKRYLIGSSLGWLITADERSEMHLVNPVTSQQIALPSVVTIEQVTPIFDENGVICKYCFSRQMAGSVAGPPSTLSLSRLRDYLFHKAFLFYDASARSNIIVLIHSPLGQLSFARLGDEKWTWLPPHANFDDCIYKDGLLYAVTLLGEIITFDLSGTVVTTKIIMNRRDTYGTERVYIVQAPWGDLLLVRRPEVWIDEAPTEHGHACNDQAAFENRTWKIAIYKVCTASSKLVQINSLHDHVLFLGHNQSLCFHAEEYPQVKPNHVYLTDDSKSASMKRKLRCRLVIGILDRPR